MRRRAFLERCPGIVGTGAVGGSALSAGCLGELGQSDSSAPATRVENPPAGVYRPPAVSSLRLVGIAGAGDVRLALLYGYPSRFWEVVGEQTYERGVEPDDSVHLSALAWDPATDVVLPEVGLTVEVRQDGHLVTEEAVYAMLSQRMGFHYGDNFALDGDGTYQVTVSLGGLHLRRTGAFAGRFARPVSHTFEFEYRRARRDELAIDDPPDPGSPGAVEPDPPDGVPTAVVPTTELPGERLARPADSGVTFDVRLLRDDAADRRRRTSADDDVDADVDVNAAAYADADVDGNAGVDAAAIDGESAVDAPLYLAVIPHTPYNRLLLPSMGLRLRLEAGDTSAGGVERILDRTMDPELGYHHGTDVPDADLTAATRLVIETLTPPQVARHEGYETAFLDLDEVVVDR